MNFDKQHAVLEEIFDYLLSNGRKDLVDKYNASTKSKETEKVCTARRDWKCCKCRQPIHRGEKYFCITIFQRAIYVSKRYCLNCSSLSVMKKQNKLSKMNFINKS